MYFHPMRDCDAWSKQGLKMNTNSNECCKLYDAALSQYVKWYESEDYGGLDKTLANMLNSDENFILGYCLKYGLELIGTSIDPYNVQHKNELNQFSSLTHKLSQSLTKRETDHVKAIKSLFRGDLLLACDYWEEILIENPTDLMALKFAHDSYFYLGFHPQMRDSIARVLPYWKTSLPLYSSLFGLYSFGLVQSNYFEEAKKQADKALELNSNDGWATHSICHYYEYKTEYDAGIKFLNETEGNWSICNLLSSHNYWHLGLYHVEKSEHDVALEIFDKHIAANSNLNRTLDMVDAISLLYRLKLDCYEPSLESRWTDIMHHYKSRKLDHGYIFNDSHIAMLLSACGNENDTSLFLLSLDDYLKESSGSFGFLKKLNSEYAEKIFNAIFAFQNGEFAKVVELLYPVRYELVKIGGSNAQRDIFSQLLIQAALKSHLKSHNKIGLALLNERIALKPNSNLTRRISARFASQHELE